MADESGAGLQGARDKAAEYADRIRAGASAHTVCEGLGPVFRESVMRLVEADASRQDLSVLCELETGKFTEFLQRALQRPAWGWSPGEDLFVHGASVADGTRYDAHGIAKGTLTDQIACLVGLLETGPDTARQFHTAPYNAPSWMGAGFGTAGGAYRDGLFVLLSHRDSLLADAANPGQIAVMSVLVNEAGYGLIPYLRARYPHIAFVRGDEQQAFFERLTKESRA